jgi:DNA-binding XRE family transcriptional regulator
MARKLPHDFDHETGLRLQRVRAKLGLSGADVADRLEISRGYWSELENSKAAPGKSVLSALRRVFGVRVEYVLSGAAPMFEPGEDGDAQQVDIVDVRGPVAGGPAGEVQVVGQAKVYYGKVASATTHTRLSQVKQEFDSKLLSEVLGVVLTLLQQKGLVLESAKLAELVSLIYEQAAAQQASGRSAEGVDAITKTTERFVSLLA